VSTQWHAQVCVECHNEDDAKRADSCISDVDFIDNFCAM